MGPESITRFQRNHATDCVCVTEETVFVKQADVREVNGGMPPSGENRGEINHET